MLLALPRVGVIVARYSPLRHCRRLPLNAGGDMQEAMTEAPPNRHDYASIPHISSARHLCRRPSNARWVARLSDCQNYIYALNILYQMGIQARVIFIRGRNCQRDNSTYERFEENVKWTLGVLSDEERARLHHWYQQQAPQAIAPATRDWALISPGIAEKEHDLHTSGANRCMVDGRYSRRRPDDPRAGNGKPGGNNGVSPSSGRLRERHCAGGADAAKPRVNGHRTVGRWRPGKAGEVLLRATGRACALQQGWKAVQNVLEWSCGVSAYVAQMLALLHTRLPNAHIACTRKAIGTRLLGTRRSSPQAA